MRRNDAIDTSRNNRWTFGSALAHYARVYLMLRQRSALTFRAAAFKRRHAACERLAERRVVPPSNEFWTIGDRFWTIGDGLILFNF